jgi:hypothetical protein
MPRGVEPLPLVPATSVATLLSPAGLWRDSAPLHNRISLRATRWFAVNATDPLSRLMRYRTARVLALGQTHGRPGRVESDHARAPPGHGHVSRLRGDDGGDQPTVLPLRVLGRRPGHRGVRLARPVATASIPPGRPAAAGCAGGGCVARLRPRADGRRSRGCRRLRHDGRRPGVAARLSRWGRDGTGWDGMARRVTYTAPDQGEA